MKHNAFHQPVPEIKETLQDFLVREYCTKTLTSVLSSLLVEKPEEVAEQVLALAETYEVLEQDYEQRAHVFLENQGITAQRVSAALSGRADVIYSQVRPYLQGSSVLDLGCGDGKVGQRIAQDGFQVVLADVYKHPQIDATGLEFIPFEQGQEVADSGQYDNTLLLTVMHHSDDPIKTLLEAKKRTKAGGRLIVIESVYGIDGSIREPSYGEKSDQIAQDFKRLRSEQQRMANIFFDHFYNRAIHYSEDPSTKVNVPFNFRTPQEWEQIFAAQGLKSVALQYLGIDQPAVPEYHTLHVLRK